MKIVQINAVCGTGSTGNICVSVSRLLTERHVENYILYAAGNSSYESGIRYMSPSEIKVQALRSRVFGNYGFTSGKATRRLTAELDRIQPDIVHLHNLHSHNCHLGMLFDYLRETHRKVFWTFHDCWAFTGYCPHFAMAGCERWRSGCGNCPLRSSYSWFFDHSHELYEKKKAMVQGVDLTVITPSAWLGHLVQESFLSDVPVRVIHNGIDLSVFHPTESDFRKKYGLENRFILLGVAFGWGEKKGLDVFVRLSERLDDRFRIVLVGTDAKTEKELASHPNILCIKKTESAGELAGIYTAADVLLNATREENFPTVNMEAIACGTPVITFRTGGSPEILSEGCGTVVPYNDEKALEREAIRACTERPYSRQACLDHAREFDRNDRFADYVRLYEEAFPPKEK